MADHRSLAQIEMEAQMNAANAANAANPYAGLKLGRKKPRSNAQKALNALHNERNRSPKTQREHNIELNLRYGNENHRHSRRARTRRSPKKSTRRAQVNAMNSEESKELKRLQQKQRQMQRDKEALNRRMANLKRASNKKAANASARAARHSKINQSRNQALAAATVKANMRVRQAREVNALANELAGLEMKERDMELAMHRMEREIKAIKLAAKSHGWAPIRNPNNSNNE
jgi:predicted ATP-dependent endonuclease of OLD family